MSWYRSGTVTVTNGSSTVSGAGTDFVANAQIGHAFLGPDGKVYEIAQVEAAGQIVLAGPYLGGSGAGQGYAIMPTSSFARDLALGAAQLLNTFATVRDTVGQGLFPDGSQAAPGVRFAADQDTGIRRSAANGLALVTGGEDRLVATAIGVGIGTPSPKVPLDLGASSTGPRMQVYSDGTTRCGFGIDMAPNAFGLSIYTNSSLAFGRWNGTTWDDYGRFDASGHLLVGTTIGDQHRICKSVGQGGPILLVRSTAAGLNTSAVFAGVHGYTPNGSSSAQYLGHSTETNRSLNASGTLNASGADYAEYMRKADGCGTIAKGDVCGVDGDGHLTKVWADARSFVVKSTDPSYVGGDTWGLSCGPRPEGPGEEPMAPRVPPAAPASDDEMAVKAWQAIVAEYPTQLAAYQSAHDAWTTAKAAHDAALPAWEAALEAARQKVDRIAFSGQVPVNVTGDFAVGDYIIAAAQGAGIKAVAVPADTITFDQYRRRLGKVWAVRDGRAWVDVQHG